MTATFSLAIGLAAALVFMVQPMVARMLLPSLGGSTVVWSTALVFFQVALVGGYLIAHLVGKRRQLRWVYIGLLVLAGAVTLPFAAPESTPDWSAPSAWLLSALSLMVGAPFVLLCAASPLLQRWFAESADDGDSAYHLYAASNIGSIAGLLAYPFIVEPLAPLGQQAIGWALAFGVAVILLAACARVGGTAQDVAEVEREVAEAHPAWWVFCAALPSALLVTMTASITADIAPVPLLWVVPLVVYLASHAWVYSRRPPSHEKSLIAMFALAIPYASVAFFDIAKPWWFQAGFAVVVLGAIAVAYHGELVRTRPPATDLTKFYLATAIGGALGGAFASFAGPALFDTLFELKLELALALAVLAWRRAFRATWKHTGAVAVIGSIAAAVSFYGEPEQPFVPAVIMLAVSAAALRFDVRALAVALAMGSVAPLAMEQPVLAERSPYARYRVLERESALGEYHELVVGRVMHGGQMRDPKLRALPLAYYHPSGPVGQVVKHVERGEIGVIGLGVGSMAAYARDQRTVHFIELDPVVKEIAEEPKYFTYLKACGSRCSVSIGDGRLELEKVDDGSLALIVLDAFSGDAIPTHLLTVEAFELYKRKLRSDGMLLVNASNMYVDVAQVVVHAAHAAEMMDFEQEYWPREAHLRDLRVSASEWVVLLKDYDASVLFENDPRWTRRKDGFADDAWTDDWQNLFKYYMFQ